MCFDSQSKVQHFVQQKSWSERRGVNTTSHRAKEHFRGGLAAERSFALDWGEIGPLEIVISPSQV